MTRIGICSWSLRPSSPLDLAERVRALGVPWVQIALDPIRAGEWDEAETAARLGEAGVGIASGMMAASGEDYTTLESIRRTGGLVPDGRWEENLAAAGANAALARRLGIGLVTLHAGFLPHDPRDPRRGVLLDRLRAVAGRFAGEGVALGLETGQESAETLAGFLRDLDRAGVGVNFDPANMILYGMGDPVAGLDRLAPWVRQIHIKDALPAAAAGRWGSDVPLGTGAVDWDAFFAAVGRARLSVDLMIEREAGEDRAGDIARAHRMVLERLGGRT